MIEKIALAGAMVHNELVAELHVEYFQDHHDIAKVVKRLYYEQKKISPNFVKMKLGESEELNKILEVYPTIEEGREALNDLRESYRKRSTVEAMQEAIKMAERHDVDKVLKILGDRLNSMRSVGAKTVKTGAEVAAKLLDRMSEARMKGAWEPLTGIHSVDQLCKGYKGGDVIIVLAGYKVGKSAIMSRVIENAIVHNTPSYVGSGEMQDTDILIRPLSSLSSHTTDEIESGSVISDDRFLQSMDQAIAADKVFYCDQSLSIAMMEEHVTTYNALYGVRLFQFDQINLFKEARQREWQGIQEVVASARVLANQLNVAIVLYHQVNASELVKPHYRPSVTGARGGTSALAQATKVLLLYRPEHHGLVQFEDGPFKGIRAHGLMEVLVGVGNNLRSGSAMVRFIGEQQIIAPLYPGTNFEGVNLDEPFYYGAIQKIDEKPLFYFEDEEQKDDLPF